MIDEKLYTSLSANTIMATDQSRLTDQLYNIIDWQILDSEDDFRSGCRNVGHQQQFFSELPSPGPSHNTNYRYSWVQTINYEKNLKLN